jgi:hypothetical protein
MRMESCTDPETGYSYNALVTVAEPAA